MSSILEPKLLILEQIWTDQGTQLQLIPSSIKVVHGDAQLVQQTVKTSSQIAVQLAYKNYLHRIISLKILIYHPSIEPVAPKMDSAPRFRFLAGTFRGRKQILRENSYTIICSGWKRRRYHHAWYCVLCKKCAIITPGQGHEIISLCLHISGRFITHAKRSDYAVCFCIQSDWWARFYRHLLCCVADTRN